MTFDTSILTESQVRDTINITENQFYDVKAKEIKPAKLSESVSAFSNADGGELFIGIHEDGRFKNRSWDGFNDVEEANAIIQMLESLSPLSNYYNVNFLEHPTLHTIVVHLTIHKTIYIIKSTGDKIYARHGAQNLPVDTAEKIRRLELDKGLHEFETEVVPESDINDALESEILEMFHKAIIPKTDKETWLRKQKLCKSDNLILAGILLFTDIPQVVLPKRSAIKIFRYKTSEKADRDMLDGQPITIEGCAYNQIYEAVAKVKEIIETVKRLGDDFECIKYPEETLHEIITNAVLHRDYSISTDIQIRIYDNRVEVESPGKLPGNVTVKNILDTQFARNSRIVRLINKFPNPPNKDVGEGMNTAFEAMKKLRLKEPDIQNMDNSVLVIIRHEKLASPEEMVINYMQDHEEITNTKGRELTGIKSENSMKRVFIKLRETGLLEQIPGRNGPSAAWRLTDKGKHSSEVIDEDIK